VVAVVQYVVSDAFLHARVPLTMGFFAGRLRTFSDISNHIRERMLVYVSKRLKKNKCSFVKC